ncbi:MAG: non-heme iron oxygenase ferredoxin subunit [Candidatus Dormibacteraceae bacterium]
MAEQVRVGRVGDLEPESAKQVQAGGFVLCLARAEDGTYHAIDDECSHEEYSLSEGEVWGDEIECPAHGSKFSLVTGAVRGFPATQPVRAYPTRVDGDDVIVEVPS